jgi:nicotinamide-nucleotide amidase
VDTNSIWVAERLGEMGLGLSLKTCVGDDYGELKVCLAAALQRSDLIVTTGGLGPTFDDRTKDAFAELLGATMHEDAKVRAEIDSFFLARGRAATRNNYHQALIPKGAIPLHNTLGTAPGVYWEVHRSGREIRIVMLPGVPREMSQMWVADVAPRLAPFAKEPMNALRVVASGVGESALDERAERVREKHPHIHWTILAPRTHVEFLMRSKNAEALHAARRDLEAELGADLVCVGDGSPESTLLDTLRERGETLAAAESVSGGTLTSRLVGVPGASRAFLGGAVAYSPIAKTELLGIGAEFVTSHGTVGYAITREMAVRVRERVGATWGLALTGNAGPAIDENALQGEGRDEVGKCFVALSGPGLLECRAHSIHGTRADIQMRASNWAIDMLRRVLAGKPLSV